MCDPGIKNLIFSHLTIYHGLNLIKVCFSKVIKECVPFSSAQESPLYLKPHFPWLLRTTLWGSFDFGKTSILCLISWSIHPNFCASLTSLALRPPSPWYTPLVLYTYFYQLCLIAYPSIHYMPLLCLLCISSTVSRA